MNRPRGLAALVALAVTIAFVVPAAWAVLSDESPAAASDEDFAAGRLAVERKQWDEAVRRLGKALARHPDDAELHNALGYAYRQRKQMDRAFEHYRRALALDPRHRAAHEYIGEAYLMVGDVPGAERHLRALREICLLPCEELADLEKALARHRPTTGTGAPALPR